MDTPVALEKSHPIEIDTRLSHRFQCIRQQSLTFCQPLELEDYGLQAIAETSPPKWHLAHTTWFFETFVLKVFVNVYQSINPQYEVLFNSYYNGIGQQHPRHQRGLLSRPGLSEVLRYRQAVDQQIMELLDDTEHPDYQEILSRVELGLHHEQQHQELFFTDIKFSFFQNPLYPVYCPRPLVNDGDIPSQLTWQEMAGGINVVGHHESGFCFDNERPQHQALLTDFYLSNRLITNGEYLRFIEDHGYQRPELWLADGWHCVKQNQWLAPCYWLQQDGQWFEYTLHGLTPLNINRPVVHVSAFEADAYARWADARLATEFELEAAAKQQPGDGQFVECGEFHPRAAGDHNQIFGSTWEWTSSAYGPYPNYRADKGAIGEYNGKFMCNQLVLRGGSCVTSQDHMRSSYRNFFYPQDRWQFSGIRLARSIQS